MNRFEVKKENWYRTTVLDRSYNPTLYALTAQQGDDFLKAMEAGVSEESLELLIEAFRKNV